MPSYIRAKMSGGKFFFTVVTYRRRKILTEPESRYILRQVVDEVRRQYPFFVDAWVLLPDHLHCLWTLPEGDEDFSKRWGLIKAVFSRKIKGNFHKMELMTDSKERHREGTIWQRRFWEHQIRDDADFERHFHYIHYNPVKHGLVPQVRDWPFSTFHRYVEEGLYSLDWGGNLAFDSDKSFGE
ncbi:MAG TPA: transposase [Desulfobaccales bacterium]